VGAGPAGLAVGACLKQAGISCLILEQADKVGVAWHRHYERLNYIGASDLLEENPQLRKTGSRLALKGSI
jgi:cation diffusion facilitator CzcD-associated flavoprotein CzcO